MFSLTSASLRWLALLLPVALLGVFVACILSCSARAAESVELRCEESRSAALADDCGDCRLGNALSCALPRNESYLARRSDNPPVAPSQYTSQYRDELVSEQQAVTRLPDHPSTPERISILRI